MADSLTLQKNIIHKVFNLPRLFFFREKYFFFTARIVFELVSTVSLFGFA